MSASAIYFTNTSNEDFTAKWDSVPYTVKAGQTILLQAYIAVHLAKHLAMREMGKRDAMQVINPSQDESGNFTNVLFSQEVRKYLSEEEVKAETPEKLEMAIITGNSKKVFCDKCDSKGVKHKKDCPTLQKEEEFPELNK